LVLALATLVGCAGDSRPLGDAEIVLPCEEVDYAMTVHKAVFDATDDMFAALQQAKRQHSEKYGSNPELYRRLDQLTMVLWALDGGEMAGAECRIRGFQFGTPHHDRCVYEVKMAEVRKQQRANEAAVPRVSQPAPVQEHVARGGKVYSAEECIGPVIMGECHGSILPRGATTRHATGLG
jgi:hypothetical protein